MQRRATCKRRHVLHFIAAWLEVELGEVPGAAERVSLSHRLRDAGRPTFPDRQHELLECRQQPRRDWRQREQRA